MLAAMLLRPEEYSQHHWQRPQRDASPASDRLIANTAPAGPGTF
jgi:hypothetical protein